MKLKDLRAAHVPPLTQTQLAVAAHISLRMVQEWEAGRRSIDRASLETLCDIANALDCRIHDLIQSPVLLIKLDDATTPLRKRVKNQLTASDANQLALQANLLANIADSTFGIAGGGDDHDDV